MGDTQTAPRVLLVETHHERTSTTPPEMSGADLLNPFLSAQREHHQAKDSSQLYELQSMVTSSDEAPEIVFVVEPSGGTSLAIRLDRPEDFKDSKSLLEPMTAEERMMMEQPYPFSLRDWPSPFAYDERRLLEMDEIVNMRRKRVFLFMVCLDFFYCLLLLFVSISLGDGVTDEKVSKQTPLVRLFWAAALLTDVLGFVACLRDSQNLLTAFILLEGVTVVGFSFLVFSPLVILRLIIFLLSLQVRIGMHVSQAARAAVHTE